jgi:iron-sulfur cluster repair protein YtfE (RIC family)
MNDDEKDELIASLRQAVSDLTDRVEELTDACNQSRLAFAGLVSVESDLRKLDSLHGGAA